jgi:hypothetical protein
MASSRKPVSRPKLVASDPEPSPDPIKAAAQTQEASDAGTGDDKKIADADDIEALWEDDSLGDPLTTTHVHNIPVGKPKDFFWACSDRKYRKKTWLYAYKSENVVGEQYFIVDRPMRDRVRRARPCTLLAVVDRAGAPRIWPLWSPRPGENDNIAWITARSVAREGLTNWTRLEWINPTVGYASEAADPGYAPVPDFSKLPPFNEMIKTAFGPDGIWRNEENRAYRACFGKVAKEPDALVSDGEDEEDADDGNAEDAVS